MLTNATVMAAKPGAREYELPDGKIPGLKLRVRTSGAKSWVFRYRAAGGQRRVRLGGVPGTSLADARKAASGILAAVERGEDPAAAKAADREAVRMRDLFGTTSPDDPKQDTEPGWYLDTYVLTAGRLGTSKTAKGIANDRSSIKAHLRPHKELMRKRVADVTRADVEKLKASVSAGAWNKLRNILVIAFTYCEETGQIPVGSNPAKRVKPTPDKPKERFLSADERARLEEALARSLELGPYRGGHSASIVRAIRILALTGMRRGEVLSLAWAQVDLDRGFIRLATSKTGAKPVPISPQAIAYLRAEKGDAPKIGLVCPAGEGGPLAPDHVSKAWRSITKTAKLPGLRLHDLRHSLASDAASAGVPMHVIARVLGHKTPRVTARYAHLSDTAVSDGLAVIGAAIEAATKGKAK